MIRVTVEMLPHGSEERKYPLGVVEIINDGTGDEGIGNYDVTLHKSPHIAKTPGIWKKGYVAAFPRAKLGPYDLLLRALQACIGKRNPEAE